MRHLFMPIGEGNRLLGAYGADRNCAHIIWFPNFARLTLEIQILYTREIKHLSCVLALGFNNKTFEVGLSFV